MVKFISVLNKTFLFSCSFFIGADLDHFTIIMLMVSFALSMCVNLILIKKIKAIRPLDSSPQNIHEGTIPRVGGLGVFAATIFIIVVFSGDIGSIALSTTLCALPALLLGLMEDLRGGIQPIVRFCGTLVVGFLFCYFLEHSITNVEFKFGNLLLSALVISVPLTALAVAALANGFNMIDGLHGLSSGAALVMLATLAYVCFDVGDGELGFLSLLIFFSTLGFWVFNFPHGKIFLGDGGAYFLGVMIASIAILLPERNNSVSPYFSLLVVVYPFQEVVRSTIRRGTVNLASAFEADNGHLHSSLFQLIKKITVFNRTTQNIVAASITLLFPIASCLAAAFYYLSTDILIISILFFVTIFEVASKVIKSKI